MKKNNSNINIGLNIKKHRKLLKMTQDELATASGMSRFAIGSYERGHRIPSAEIIYNIANVLMISVDKLLNDEIRENQSEGNSDRRGKIENAFFEELELLVIDLKNDNNLLQKRLQRNIEKIDSILDFINVLK